MLDSPIQRVRTAFSMTRFLVFIGVALSLLGVIHYYLWIRLARDPQWPAPWNTVIGWFFVVAAVGMPAAAIIARGRSHTSLGKLQSGRHSSGWG